MGYIIKDTKIIGKSVTGIKLKLPKFVKRDHLRIIKVPVEYDNPSGSEPFIGYELEIVNLNDLTEFWVRREIGQWGIYATPLQGTQLISMNFSERNQLALDENGVIYLRTTEQCLDDQRTVNIEKAKRKFVKHIARDERLFFCVMLLLKHADNPTTATSDLIQQMMLEIEPVLPAQKISTILLNYALDIKEKATRLWNIISS